HDTPRLRDLPVVAARDTSRSDHAMQMVYAGPVEPWAGLDTVLRGLAELRVRTPDIALMIAGTGSAIPSLRSIARQLGVGGVVERFHWERDARVLVDLIAGLHAPDATRATPVSRVPAIAPVPRTTDSPVSREPAHAALADTSGLHAEASAAPQQFPQTFEVLD